MSDADWIEDAAMHYQHGDCFDDLASLFSKAYAEHCRQVDHDKLAERIAEAVATESIEKGGTLEGANITQAIQIAIEPLLARNAALEAELANAAKILQAVLPIGQVKHIGLLEVAAGVQQLAEDNAAMEAVLRECREHIQDIDIGYLQPIITDLLSRIDQLTAKGAGQ